MRDHKDPPSIEMPSLTVISLRSVKGTAESASSGRVRSCGTCRLVVTCDQAVWSLIPPARSEGGEYPICVPLPTGCPSRFASAGTGHNSIQRKAPAILRFERETKWHNKNKKNTEPGSVWIIHVQRQMGVFAVDGCLIS